MAGTKNSIITPQTPRSANAVCVTGNTGYGDTPTASVLLFTAGANGARLTRLTAIPRATVTATELQLFRDLSGAGTQQRLFKSKLMAAYTVAQTTENVPTDFGYSDLNALILGANERLYVAIGVSLAGGIVFTAEAPDY